MAADPNSSQRSDWNGESGLRWVAEADRRDRVLAPVLDVLLAAARIEPGDVVLDIGCGCGATTLAAAAALEGGAITGVDLSRPMLEVARGRAGAAQRIDFVEADAQVAALASLFDVAISRFGTMFFDDPLAAFRNIRQSMSARGRLCIATWQPLAANEWLVVPGAALLAYTSTPPVPDAGPGMFAQADAGAVIETLSSAGWRDVHVEPVEVVFRLGSDPSDATEYLSGTGVARRVLDTIDPAARPAALESVTEALAAHMSDGDGVHLRGGVNIVTADR